MTPEPTSPDEPATDPADLAESPSPFQPESDSDPDSNTDAMGIDDDDPIDATLVGSATGVDEQPEPSKGEQADPDEDVAERSASGAGEGG